MKERRNKQASSALGAILVFGVFGVSILLVLLSFAGSYQRLNHRAAASYDSRTCAQYLTTKVRQAPEGVTVGTFAGVTALVIPQTIDGEACVTRVYCYDGWLMELFSLEDGVVAPVHGEKLLPAKDLQLQWRDGLLTAVITPAQGSPVTVILHTREEARP